jgi:hypothetical protein
MRIVKWFLAGALAVPLGHQLVLALLYAVGFTDRAPFPMDATEPFGVPQLLSLSFWGGVWGIVLGLVLRRTRRYWLTAALFGAIAPTLVAGLIVMPLKGMAVGFDPRMAVFGLLVNGAWGLATAGFIRILDRSIIDR